MTSSVPGPIGTHECIAMQPLQHVRHVDGLACRLSVRGFQARQFQQVGDDGVHALRLGAHVPYRAFPGRVDRRIIGQRIKVSGNHGQRRAQLMRCIGDEVLAHRFQAHLAGHIVHQQQGLAASVGDHLQRQISINLYRRPDDQRQCEVIAVQIMRKLRGADQVVDSQAHIDRPPQAEQARRLAVEPYDLVLRTQDDHAVRQRRRGTTQFPVQLHQALLVVLLAPMQAHHLGDDIAPNSAKIRRVDLRAQPQPAVQTIKIQQLPAQVQAC